MSVEIHLNLDCTNPWAGVPGLLHGKTDLSTSIHHSCFLLWMECDQLIQVPAAMTPATVDYTLEL